MNKRINAPGDPESMRRELKSTNIDKSRAVEIVKALASEGPDTLDDEVCKDFVYLFALELTNEDLEGDSTCAEYKLKELLRNALEDEQLFIKVSPQMRMAIYRLYASLIIYKESLELLAITNRAIEAAAGGDDGETV